MCKGYVYSSVHLSITGFEGSLFWLCDYLTGTKTSLFSCYIVIYMYLANLDDQS